ncbi:ATP-binding protein [Microcystis aeruginosa LEGE 11464]|uniref:NB-ARC domain-containing protein n=1 Tax=Microcystis aeruginosa TaxID=1126 RepID=UPI0018823705|nr:NB-ARC domain-containing protein [Microcystis aeruginosa]MBE9091395.1 ATP-binding protein [Microcystis aeruginosa LEGE 11464]
MDVTEISQFADQLIFAKKGKHLDDLQKTVIAGVYEGKTYDTIAEECHRSESRVRSVDRQLWKLLSESLGEDINKYNFCWTIERAINSQLINIVNGDVNYYHDKTQEFSEKGEKIIDNESYYDLSLAPSIIKFYNRETELETLSKWILNQNISLISVLGLSGLGKTTLVKKSIDLNLEHFEVIIWKNLKFPKSLDLLVDDLLRTCQQEAKETLDDKLNQLFAIFTQKRCLIILDDVQNIFITGQLAGQYQPEYQDYQKFFTMITTTEHKSNIVLISQEKCSEMHCLDPQLYPIKCLELSGLHDTSILDNTGLNNQDDWLKLIQLYEGNLIYLKDIISLIQDLYDGEVAEFLAENNLVISRNMQSHFNNLFNRLSLIEQQITLELSKLNQPISRADLKQKLSLASVDFVNSLQSLQQRYLVTKIKEEKILFELSPVFKEYVKTCCQN